ncbi:MAG: hypothetical protein AB8F94_18615 [Saprospiraceae bacterium]
MKKLSILFFVFFYSISLFADCGMSGLWVFPKGGEIAKNSIIMIEGYAASQKIINNLDGKNSAYLQSENHIVKLKVEIIKKGGFGLTQAILKPQELLKVGEEYWLKIDGLNERMNKVDSYRNQKTKWKVKNEIDTKNPFWKSEMRPKFLNTTYIEYGCGPEIFAHFQVKINDDSETLVKTEVMDLKTKVSTIYYLTSKAGKISIGHGMCSGAFSLSKNGKYKVRFDLMDASGNSFGRWSESTEINGFQTKMGMLDLSKSNNLSLPIGVILFFIAIFFKRHSEKV